MDYRLSLSRRRGAGVLRRRERRTVVIVVPKLDLVVAFYGGNYADRPARIPREEWMPKFVLPAVAGM